MSACLFVPALCHVVYLGLFIVRVLLLFRLYFLFCGLQYVCVLSCFSSFCVCCFVTCIYALFYSVVLVVFAALLSDCLHYFHISVYSIVYSSIFIYLFVVYFCMHVY